MVTMITMIESVYNIPYQQAALRIDSEIRGLAVLYVALIGHWLERNMSIEFPEEKSFETI